MIRYIFFKDFGWKLFSLLLAVFIWLTVDKIIEPKPASNSPANSLVTVEYGNVPVLVVATAADMHQYAINSNTVSVTVSGPHTVMDVLQANQIHATVDLSNFDEKSKNMTRRVDVSVPWGVTVVDIAPAELKIVPPKK
jgi:hypothetical protein